MTMADFEEIRTKLLAIRTDQSETECKLFLVNEQLKQVAGELEQSDRWFDASNPKHVQRRGHLESQLQNLTEDQDECKAILERIKNRLAEILSIFWEEWTDPRSHAGEMNDDMPIMLFPLRIETRFKTLSTDLGEQQQLWVRVYPDDCLVDTFEETLAQVELHSARVFWREYFRAAGVEEEERAAWRALVASHGSGRATWIIQQFRPLNPLHLGDSLGEATLEMKPQAKATGELILVVPATKELTSQEKPPLAQYWEAIWKANGQSGLETAALNTLIGIVGIERAKELIKQFRPYNLTEKPQPAYSRQTTSVHVSFLYLPENEDIAAKSQSWMKAAKVELLPERFVLLGYRKDPNGWQKILNELSLPVQAPFSVSPDPNLDTDSQFPFDEYGNLGVGDNLRWMVDFDEAVQRGMGFRINLTEQQAAGFDRLFVLGIRLGSDAAQGKTELEALFKHHYFSRTGFAFLSQGTPTNNTEESNAGYSRVDDANASYDFVFKGQSQFTETEDWLTKRDGQWFAESLGLDIEWLKQVPQAGGGDQCEARAMNAALWPATLGYFMDTLLQPVFNDDDIYYTRWFFNRFVSGRGMIPAIRIGRQPYGILPTSAFTKISWLSDEESLSYLDYFRNFQEERGRTFKEWLWKFKDVLDQLYPTWLELAQSVSHIGLRDKDPHQNLLDIVGLHPASVEFHQRRAKTKKQVHNIAWLWQLPINWQTLPANDLHNEAFARLGRLGYGGEEKPKLFNSFWDISANRLNGPIIQEGSLSETESLRKLTPHNQNYIEWLYEWAQRSFDTIRVQDGFNNDQWPNALLYLLLRHALELGYHDASIRLLDDAQLLNDQQRRNLRTEPHFFHIHTPSTTLGATDLAADNLAGERSRYEILYSPNAHITGDPRQKLVDYLTLNLDELFATRYLTEQLRALEQLQQTPTARLERALVEHLDCGTYRLDAWMSGLINFQLTSMRFARRGDQEGVEEGISHRKGIYLGAYGWLENVRPENKILSPVELQNETLDETFNQKIPENQRTPLVKDEQNEGYIHAPSVNHAITAAILRNGYLSNATPEYPDLLKVNLSSERVRTALGTIEGIRNGQNLATLLGYQFERGLHDRYSLAESDQFIYPLRKVFPLYTQQENLPEGVPIEGAVEARNVINGLHLIRHIKDAPEPNKTYPFGFSADKLPPATPAQQDMINREVSRLLNLYDAVADLAIAEGVHQIVMGNYDGAAAALDAYGQATFPPLPEVVQTPRSGIGVTHRVGLHFETNVAIAPADNPRVKAEPAMNKWLDSLLPVPTRVSCKVSYLDIATGNLKVMFVSQANLGLRALDLLYMVNPGNLQARSELEDRVRDYVLEHAVSRPRPDVSLEITYMEGDTGHLTFFELAPMIRSLQALLLHARPLHSTDVALPTEAKPDNASNILLDRNRVDFLTAPSALPAVTHKLHILLEQLDAVFPEAGPDTAIILREINNYLADIINACKSLALYGLQQTGFGIFHETKGRIFKELVQKASDLVERWQQKLTEYEDLIAALPTQLDEAQRIELLLEAERVIATTFTDTAGKTSAQVHAEIEAKKVLFEARKNAFEAFTKTTRTNLSEVLADFKLLLPIAEFDLQETKTEDIEKQIVLLASDIRLRTKQLGDELNTHLIPAIQAKLAEHDAQSAAEKKVQLLSEAAKLVFGEEFVVVPSFLLAEYQAEEWAKAYAGRAQLLDYQKNVLNNDFPVDDWLYGTARVRQKMHHLENLIFLAEAFDTAAADFDIAVPELRPVQFPFDAAAPWLALKFPPEAPEAPEANKKLERENLLYSAIYSVDFDKTQRQCGLLLDEWTEVIPAETETTGITFHFDKPNTEPPQTILLATPSQFTGTWQWEDLVGTLHETLDMARIRAVEPQQLDQKDMGVFLPATMLATTPSPVTIAADLAAVNNYLDKMPKVE
jgi:hypothetical protein